MSLWRALSSGRAAPWLRFLARRAGGFVVGAVILVVGSFAMIHLVPGDPIRASLGTDAQPALVQQRRAELHLDRPIYIQFAYYLDGLAHLNFGTSIQTGESVTQVIRDRFPNTARLAFVAIGLVALIGIPIGLTVGAATASGRRRPMEFGFAFATGTVTAIPEYLMGTLLVVIFGLTLRWLPAAGKSGLDSYVLPAFALALAPASFLARVVRLETVKVLGSEYMTTARGKHLPARIFYLRHAFPNVLTAALTIAGLVFGTLLGGSVIIENIFGWPGIGTTVVAAILNKDFPVVQACVLLLGLMVLAVNTLVDVALAAVNPSLATLQET
jgi:ABC-type dipeptide/oligopeptide/nickel transport system permease component